MLRERLQVLVSTEQRRRLEAEAERRKTSVGSLVREAIDARFAGVAAEDRVHAVEGIVALAGTFLDPETLERLIEDERLAAARPASPPVGDVSR